MRADCIKKVAAAAGKALSQAKIKAIDDAMSGKMRDLARQDPQAWASKSADQRATEAAQAVMYDIHAEAARFEYLGTLQLLKTAETNLRIAEAKQASAMDLTQSQALVRDIQNTQNYTHTVHDEAMTTLDGMLDAASSKDGTGLLRNLAMRVWDLDNPQMTADVVREVFRGADGHTGNKVAQAGARAWLDTIESLRLRFNAAGGDVGKLAYGYLSQTHDAVKIQAVKAADWARRVAPLLDRRQYLRDDGSIMPDAELLPMLERVHETLASDGINKVEPGQYKGIGKRANAGSDRRVLHFQDGDAWMAYMKDFGEGSLYDAMLGHVGHMSRNIGLVERYGPNPEMQFRLQADIAQRADGVGTKANRSTLNTPEAYWAIASGKTGAPENETIAKYFQDARNVQTAAKLGGAVVTSFTDVGTIAATLHYDRLPYFDMLKNIGRNFGKDHRDFLQSHGIIAEHLTSTLNRWTGDNMTHSLTGRVANSVMKLSLMNAWTDGLRSAFSATMMQGFAKKTGTAWAKLDEWDQWLMTRKGLTESDWNIISKAKPTERDGVQYLTRDSIIRTGEDGAQQAATKWMAFVSDESQFAVVNPDMATRAIVTGGGMPAGTFRGEAMRTLMQFKSFPLAMLTRHWGRVFDTPQGLEGAPAGFGAKTEIGGTVNRMAVLAGLNVSLMVLGAVVLQTKTLLTGKDPYDMTEGKFWTRALGQGGGMGYIGDFLTKDPTEQRGSNFEQAGGVIMGPTGGAVGGALGDLILTNAWEAAKGKDTHAGAEALRWANSQLPYASLWQVRGAWEHWFIHNAQEALNPGYLGRMRARAMKDWHQEYYWPPGEAAPARAPNLDTATGGR
jgi:hypothetical protein